MGVIPYIPNFTIMGKFSIRGPMKTKIAGEKRERANSCEWEWESPAAGDSCSHPNWNSTSHARLATPCGGRSLARSTPDLFPLISPASAGLAGIPDVRSRSRLSPGPTCLGRQAVLALGFDQPAGNGQAH